MTTVDQIISRMIQALGARNMAEMLRISGFSTAAGSTWRKRGCVPDGSIARIAALANVSFEWLKLGTGDMRPPRGNPEAAPPGSELEGMVIADAPMRTGRGPFQLTAEEAAIMEMLRDLPEDERKRVEAEIMTAWLTCRQKKKPMGSQGRA